MFQYFKSFFLTFFFIFSLSANEIKSKNIYANEISLLSSNFIYNFDTDNLNIVLKKYLSKHPNIQAINIIDNISQNRLFSYYKLNNKLFYNKQIPSSIIKNSLLKYTKTNIKFDNEIVGLLEVYYKDKPIINYTIQEKLWLKKHPEIKIAVMDYLKHNQKGESFDIDILNLLSKYGGINFIPVKYKVWADGFNDAIAGKYVYGIMNLTWSKEREDKYFIYTHTYNYRPNFLIIKKNDFNTQSLKDLANKVVYIKKDSIANNLIKDEVPNAKIVNLKTEDELYTSLANNKNAVAMITSEENKNKLTEYNLKIEQVLYNKYSDLSIGVNKKYPYLASIIDKIYKIIPQEEIFKLKNKKYTIIDNEELKFTKKELAWLKKGQVIKYVYDPDWPPFEWKNNMGLQVGIVADILHIISDKSKIKFKAISTNNWSESVKLVKDGKADMFSAVIVTKERQKYMRFTKNNIYEYPAVFITLNKDNSIYTNLQKDLVGKKIGIVKANALGEFLKNKYPQFDYVYVKSTKDGFKQLEKGKIDLFGVNFITAQYYITRKGYKDVKVATKIDYIFKLKIAISKRLPNEVISIIDKSLGSISQIQKNNIFDKWTKIKEKKTTDWKLLFKIGGVVLLILLFALYSNYKLKQMVQEKTKSLKELSESLEKKVLDRTKDYKRQLRISKMAERKQDELLQLIDTKNKQLQAIHKHTKDSIEFASLIQNAFIPDEQNMQQFFKDYFTIWQPKDIVGGDIWLFNELRHKDECLLFVIDCTGHGVPGAFVTMIVKAIEREIVSNLKKHPEFDISPARIMSYFNRTMKTLLKQENQDSVSNAGFDGGIIYYNKKEQILKFCGAETPLFYIEEDKLYTIKGDRYSVGYKKCAFDYQYKEHILKVKEGMRFYLTTDGYLDQNGGKKDFPFGKKRFKKLIEENIYLAMNRQKEIFIKTLEDYKIDEQNDDITVIAFEIDKHSNNKVVEIFKYEGVLTQNLISIAMENIENKIKNIGIMSNILTITIELCQNIMHYSKNEEIGSEEIVPFGEIEIRYIDDKYYEIISKNIISLYDKQKIEPILLEIQTLNKNEIKKRYRELRKSGENTHKKGGGIGFYEIAKLANELNFDFEEINKDKCCFKLRIVI